MTRTFEELAKMDLADFVKALDNMSLEDLKANEGAILDAIDNTDYAENPVDKKDLLDVCVELRTEAEENFNVVYLGNLRLDELDEDDFDIAEEFGSDVYIECDDEDDDFDIAKEFGEDDYDPCEDPDLFRESLLNQW